MKMSENEMSLVKKAISEYHDFPKKGIVFRDIFTVVKNPTTFRYLMNFFEERIRTLCPDADVIVGLDSRGFIFAPPLSLTFGIPFIPVRKKGKLPGDVKSISYDLEYGSEVLEIQTDSIQPGSKVVIVDDLLATGGTMKASVDLIKRLNGKVALCLVAIELLDLKGREKIDAVVESAVRY